jgi:hypothetical protein
MGYSRREVEDQTPAGSALGGQRRGLRLTLIGAPLVLRRQIRGQATPRDRKSVV